MSDCCKVIAALRIDWKFRGDAGAALLCGDFPSQLNGADDDDETMATAMFELAVKQAGYIGAEHARRSNGLGIKVAYFSDEMAISAWKRNVEHLAAQRLGIQRWYGRYQIRVAKVGRAYSGPHGR
jgi:heme-degrading monooxygenase HmoA